MASSFMVIVPIAAKPTEALLVPLPEKIRLEKSERSQKVWSPFLYNSMVDPVCKVMIPPGTEEVVPEKPPERDVLNLPVAVTFRVVFGEIWMSFTSIVPSMEMIFPLLILPAFSQRYHF